MVPLISESKMSIHLETLYIIIFDYTGKKFISTIMLCVMHGCLGNINDDYDENDNYCPIKLSSIFFYILTFVGKLEQSE